MLLNPRDAIEQGWIRFPVWMSEEQREKCIQPNAIDFTLDGLFSMENAFVISEGFKQMRKFTKVEPFQDPLQEYYWNIAANTSYDGMSDFYITVPEGVAALLIVRSTFSRNGLFITSGLWDSGFKGNLGMALHNNSHHEASISPHTRIGQVMFVASENAGVYSGGYCSQPGEHWQDASITKQGTH